VEVSYEGRNEVTSKELKTFALVAKINIIFILKSLVVNLD
jgi:hypothetical protein